jgi:hypothetical protein
LGFEGTENPMEKILDRARDLEFQLLTKGWSTFLRTKLFSCHYFFRRLAKKLPGFGHLPKIAIRLELPFFLKWQ